MSDFRLSPQQAFMFGRGPSVGVSQIVLELDARLTSDELRARLEALASRYETLRTTFVTPTGARAPVAQRIHDSLEPGWDTLSGGGDLVADREACESALAREASRVDPEHGPSVRALLVEPSDGPRLLLLSALAASADPRSLALLGRELLDTGTAQAGGEPIQHADYAEWRHELLTGDDPDAARGSSFWSTAVEGIRRETVLFGAREQRDSARAAASIPIDLDSRDCELLDESAAGAELFLDAAWHALLARLTGATELLSAELLDGRSQPDLEDAIGPYEQLVAIRISIGPDARFVELIDQLARVRADARRWLDYAVEADLSRVVDSATAGFAAGASDPAVRFLSAGSTGCSIELRWLGGGTLELRYDPAVYEERDAEDLSRQFTTLLGAALADPSQPLGALRLLGDGAREEIYALGGGEQPAGGLDCVHQRFERQAAKTPDAIALGGDGVAVTFRELNERANRLAHHLIDLGVERDQPVGLCMRRSPEMVGALLAIMKAGGGYVPVNFAHPPERLAHQLEEAGVRVLVTEAALLEHLPAPGATAVVCVDRDAEEIAAHPSEDPKARSRPEDLAYVIYTSGSTGLPKGVAVTHANLDSYTAAIAERLGASEGMQFAVVSEISTDLGNTALFPPLVTGGCVHVIDNETAMDASALAAYAAEHPIDVIKITPTHLRALLAADESFLPRPRRWLVLGGEALSWELAERIEAVGAGCRVLNHYGPTETTVGCCTFEVRADEQRPPSATVPIGRPLPGARVYVLDAQLEPMPVGVAGELCVGGAGVARGYVNRPEETAERFAEDPQGGRMYRTGDRVRFLRDGSIEFLGRLDNQLKIRGYRVEPGEIETALARHPAIRETAVVPAVDGDGDPRLVAYFVAASEPPLEELRAFLAQTLPEYMLPSRWVPINVFPLTPSGKVDRLALPDPDSAPAERRVEFIAPRDEVETEIAAIWSALLGVEEVSVLDDFFALGGHSLLATQAIMRVRRSYGDIPLGALFNAPTVAALADVIRARISADAP